VSRKVKKSSNTKKFIIIGAAAALIVSTIAIAYNPGPSARSNTYIKEFVLPSQSAAPVGITVDSSGMVWFAESGTRKIGRFDPFTEKFTEYALPGSQQQAGPNPIASIWVLKFDKDGNLWFPDVPSNAIWKFDPQTAEFETYKIPTSSEFGTSYPINLEFGDDGKIWFSEIYGKNIGMLDPSLIQHNTNKGVTEISPSTNLETLGPLALDNDGNIWFTALTFPISGKLMKFEPKENSFATYSMPQGITSPVGIAPDDDGSLWINDHGTSMFINFNPSTNETTQYATSLPQRSTSIELYEKCLKQPNGSAITCHGYPVSLPYWNAIDGQGRIWFNEHQGNSIGVFDPSSGTLIEYFIPTQNPQWGACENYQEPCGISNPLQFTLAPNGKVWFTEWSESRIGVLDSNVPVPISLEILTDDKPITLSHGETLTLDIALTASEKLNANVQMRISGTIAPVGRLFNMTAEFSEEELTFNEPSTKNVSLKLTPDDELVPGNYRITVSTRYNEVTYSKIIELTVLPSKI